ncbi:MAG TPA: cytochrome c [Casimicrobiaceae bacterium]|nr:cytochrome c [Casimicrobiaceae bacterium]
MKLLGRLAAGIAASMLALGAAAQNGPGSPERGQKLYMEKMCYTCHGTVGQGGERGTGPRIAPTQWPIEAFAQQVRHPREDMPRYPAKFLSDQELADIYAYVKSIPPSRPAKDIDLLSKAP